MLHNSDSKSNRIYNEKRSDFYLIIKLYNNEELGSERWSAIDLIPILCLREISFLIEI